ncbi:hypothetical protein M2475_001978 [Breznakia sp. PF5-3]|uniref:hypothetical protein n=1 Tax=unclassified Breznakia TaxID=2623764 RepID=UPI002406D3C2|nr:MULTISPECIES: hypothetical protein [unclassified Breznakia]MDF9825531.1 hypothetical protein [Breznakia sp. PM6-1]MDF9836398.1 hypothetical protein [Breznakia sp. PF5-3]MDF9838955.1 hypothetical protein [Breznakia sp. PFB2-8]MDF9860550.1 hypothetical protein [Breznakia sp. PH5-24]
MKYRITKYNSQYRVENGAYSVDDWTSVGEIGKEFNGTKLSLEMYLRVEKKYLDSISIIFKNFNSKNIIVKKMEKYFSFEEIKKKTFDMPYSKTEKIFKKAKNEMILDLDEALILATLVLRELIWCEFTDINNKFKIQFGYDYYMYCVCDNLKKNSIKKIEELGLFVDIM